MTSSNDLVYHYTSLETLESILSHSTLRATETLTLNDPAESTFYNVYRNQISDSLEDLSEDRTGEEVLAPFIEDSLAAFCFSASKNPDNVAMWREYADHGRGVAIGLNTKKPLIVVSPKPHREYSLVRGGREFPKETIVDLDPPTWSPVTYSFDNAFEKLMEQLTEITKKYDDTQSLGEEPEETWEPWARGELQRAIVEATHTTKREGWSYEQEYRCIVAESAMMHPAVASNVKVIPDGLARYLELTERDTVWDKRSSMRVKETPDESPYKLPIERIVVGPNAGGATKKNLQIWLQNYRYESVTVSQSKSAFR